MNSLIKYLPLFLVLISPDFAIAGGIDEFAGPLEKVVNTITGDVGKLVSVAGLGLCGMYFTLSKEPIEGTFKGVLGVVVAICLIPFSGKIINALFSFSGAVI